VMPKRSLGSTRSLPPSHHLLLPNGIKRSGFLSMAVSVLPPRVEPRGRNRICVAQQAVVSERGVYYAVALTLRETRVTRMGSRSDRLRSPP